MPAVVPRRSSSNATINQIRSQQNQSRNATPTAEIKDPKVEGFSRQSSVTREQVPTAPVRRSPTLEEEEDYSSSSFESESDDEYEEMDSRRNPRFKRFGKFSMHRPGLRDDDEDDDDDSPAFLPLSRDVEHIPRENSGQDLNATLRLDTDVHRRRPAEHPQTPRKPVTAESSTSSASSGVPVSLRGEHSRRPSQAAGPLSPRRTAELARSPRGSGRETSDGTPSMGSSFSDLGGKMILDVLLTLVPPN